MPKICHCKDCPIVCETEMAENLTNWGCLPSGAEALKLLDTTGRAWACHEQQDQVCGGLLKLAIETNRTIDFSEPLIKVDEF